MSSLFPLHSFNLTAETADILIEFGYDVNAKNMAGYTPLHCQASNYPEVIDVLLKAGADVNLTDSKGRIPLHYAIDPIIRKLLIDAGSEDNMADNYGYKACIPLVDID